MYSVFRNLAIIILSAKFFGLVARKCKAPQVVGEILAGLIIGPCVLNLVQTSDAISTFAEIGVVMLMFTTGLGTNLKELIKAGPIATLVACVGVAVPLVGGTLLYSAFYGFSAVGSPEFYRALFIGTIMTATSVSITVATLQELGHLKSFLGTTIVSAAVIDDVIGIVVLTCVLGASSGTGTGLGKVLINTVLFFATAVGVGVVAHFAMTWLDKRNPHTQRITIVSMAFCFAMAYIAEEYFGIADITGAYIAGIVLCTMDDAPYVERRVDISNYIIFAPIFFASIGLKTDISGLTPEIFLFCVCFVIVALITKIIGCGLAAKICRFNWGDSLKIGVGMMTRGEVALIVAQKGLDVGVARGRQAERNRKGRLITVDHIHAEDQRNTQTALLDGDTLHVADLLHPLDIEQTAHLAAADLLGDVAALGLTGGDVARTGQVELADLLFEGHAAHQRVDILLHRSARRLLDGDGRAAEHDAQQGNECFFHIVISVFYGIIFRFPKNGVSRSRITCGGTRQLPASTVNPSSASPLCTSLSDMNRFHGNPVR